MAITGYLDDSGSDAGNPYVVVAGFAASVEQWDRFTDEWLTVEKEFAAPPFHAKSFDDARRGHGFYSEWAEARRRDYMNRLLGVIVRRTFMSFSTGLSTSAYNAVVRPDPKLRKYFKSSYGFAALHTIIRMEDWRNRTRPGVPLSFVLDEGHANSGEVRSVAKEVLVGADRLIEGVTTADDEKLPPLRAADLLAFELCAEYRNVARNKTKYSRYPLLELDKLPREWLKTEEGHLRAEIKRRFGDL